MFPPPKGLRWRAAARRPPSAACHDSELTPTALAGVDRHLNGSRGLAGLEPGEAAAGVAFFCAVFRELR